MESPDDSHFTQFFQHKIEEVVEQAAFSAIFEIKTPNRDKAKLMCFLRNAIQWEGTISPWTSYKLGSRIELEEFNICHKIFKWKFKNDQGKNKIQIEIEL